MFTFTNHYTFKWPVKVKYPSAQGDIIKEFTGEFLMPEDELEIFEQVKAESAGEMVEAVRTRLAKWWIGWEGIAVEDGGELAFSAEARDTLLRRREIRLAIDGAISEAILGVREKN